MMDTCSEAELLLCSARTNIDSKTAEGIRNLIQQDINYLFWRWGWLSIWRAITPTFKDRECFPLLSNFYLLYYLIRPVRLVRDFWLMPWQRLRTD